MARVAIIGGGIGGLAAARALSRRGIEVRIYEAAPELREIGAGVALGPNAMKVLRSLDLEDDVRAVAGRSEWALTRNGRTGRVISRTSRAQQADLFGSAAATVHRADLLDVLAHSLPSHIVTLGARCTGVEPDGEVAVAHFQDGTEVEADLVVGADGIHSAVRASLFGPDAPRFTGKICYRSVVPVDAVPGGPPPNDNTQWLGPHGTIVLYPVRRDELINVVCHYDDEAYRHESWVSECERSEVLERYAGWHDLLLRTFSAGEVWYKWALYDRDPIPTWTHGRVTVLGDAAHPMLPYLGQGACQAIEDGCVPQGSAASAIISRPPWRRGGEMSRSHCGGASAVTRMVGARRGSRSTTRAPRTCWPPDADRGRAPRGGRRRWDDGPADRVSVRWARL